MKVRAGVQTRFWHDCWVGECSLKVAFPYLFQLASSPDITGQWFLEFRRQLNGHLATEWENLQLLLSEISLSEGRDEVFWALEKSNKFSTRSLYKLMTSGGVVDSGMMVIWKCNIPLKVKIFLWMATHDRIQCGVQLKKKKWSGPEKCFICDKLETTDHILFQCPMAVFLWSFLRTCFGWPSSPTCCADFLLEFVMKTKGKRQIVTLSICAERCE